MCSSITKTDPGKRPKPSTRTAGLKRVTWRSDRKTDFIKYWVAIPPTSSRSDS